MWLVRQLRAAPERIQKRVAFWTPSAALGFGTLVGAAFALAGPGVAAALGGGLVLLGTAAVQVTVPQLSVLAGGVKRGRRLDAVALTFDDGPDPEITPGVLEVLRHFQAKATFFVLGERVQAHPNLCRQVAEAGHEIGLHGWDHRPAWSRPSSELVSDVLRTADTVSQVCGIRPTWYRAPHGFLRWSQARRLRREGFRIAGWTIGVWDTDVDVTARHVARRVKAAVRGGDVLLLHDGVADRDRPQQAMLEALPEVLEELRARGLAVVSLSQGA